ncbi:MAG: hypothetical protein ACTH2Y_12135 [Corynebacterium sp.]|uniref:hypothetical protein n=1 Tax=unclassified Corynebacterium TaxID=2624378 RepID=UPI003F9272EC
MRETRDGRTLLQLSTARRGTTEYRRGLPTLNGLATAVTAQGTGGGARRQRDHRHRQ